jgi:hypothetical protein
LHLERGWEESLLLTLLLVLKKTLLIQRGGGEKPFFDFGVPNRKTVLISSCSRLVVRSSASVYFPYFSSLFLRRMDWVGSLVKTENTNQFVWFH